MNWIMKTTTHILLIFLVSFGIASFLPVKSQDPTPIWKFARTTSEADMENMLTDSVGNCYMTGVFRSPYFRYGIDSVRGQDASETTSTFIMKTNPTGKLIYLLSVYSPTIDGHTNPQLIKINERGEAVLIVSAAYTDQCMFGDQLLVTNPATTNTLAAKISKNGHIAWIHQLLCADTVPTLKTRDAFLEESGDAYLTGYFYGSKAQLGDQIIDGLSSSDAMLFVARIEPNGTIAWFRNCPNNPLQDNASIYSTIIRNAPGDYFYLGGYHEGNRSFYFGPDSLFAPSGADAFMAMYTKDGNSQWVRSMKGDSLDITETIAVLSNGDPVLMGFSDSYSMNISGAIQTNATGLFNIYLARYDKSGNYLNSAKIGIDVPAIDFYNPNAYLATDHQDNLIVCSNFNSTSLFTGAVSLINSDPGTSDMMISKLENISFIPLWTAHGKGIGDNYFEGVHIAPSGDIWFSGASHNDLDVTGETVPGNASEGTPYLVKISSDGSKDYIYWQLNSLDNQLAMQKISADIYGNAYASGNYYGNANTLGSTDMSSSNAQGLFLAKYSRVENVSGFVKNSSGDPVTDTWVKIYGYTYFQHAPINDSVTVAPDGSYHFTDIPYGEYLVVAQPLTDDQPNYVATYYPSAVYWEFGEKIKVDPLSDLSDINISMQEKTPLEGITEMQGNVTYDDNVNKDISSSYDKGRPTKKATVVLTGSRQQKATYEVIATTQTDDDGNFAFNNIEDGVYYLWVDYPGLPVVNAYMVTVTGNHLISNLDYLVTEETVVPLGLPNYNALNDPEFPEPVWLYPNPAVEAIHFSIKNLSDNRVDIFNCQGVCVRQFSLSGSNNDINISSVEAGNYILRLVNGNTIKFYKIAIIH
jgi:hypothetical protein